MKRIGSRVGRAWFKVEGILLIILPNNWTLSIWIYLDMEFVCPRAVHA